MQYIQPPASAMSWPRGRNLGILHTPHSTPPALAPLATPPVPCLSFAAPEVVYDVVPRVELLGSGTLQCSGALLGGGGVLNAGPEAVECRPLPALWDSQGMRMALKDPRHPTHAVATLRGRLQLHVLPSS